MNAAECFDASFNPVQHSQTNAFATHICSTLRATQQCPRHWLKHWEISLQHCKTTLWTMSHQWMLCFTARPNWHNWYLEEMEVKQRDGSSRRINNWCSDMLVENLVTTPACAEMRRRWGPCGQGIERLRTKTKRIQPELYEWRPRRWRGRKTIDPAISPDLGRRTWH